MGTGNQYGCCKSCGQQVVWIKTIGGKNMPCNPNFVYYKEKAGGKDRIVLPNGQVVVGEVQKNPDHADGYGYISHFATCEYANTFRRKKIQK